MVPGHVLWKTPGCLVLGSWPRLVCCSLQFPIFMCICALVRHRRLEEPSWCFPGVYLWVLCYHRNGDPCKLGAGQPGCGGSVCVCLCVHKYTRAHGVSFLAGNFWDVKAMHLSPRQCEDSVCLLKGSDLQGSLSVL